MTCTRGYSLVEILIVIAVLSVSLLVWAEATNQMNRANKYPEAQVNFGALTTVIRETVRYQQTCQTALVGNTGMSQGAIVNGTPELKLKLPGILNDGTPADDVLQQNTVVNHIIITSLRAVNSAKLGNGSVPNSKKYFSQIELHGRVQETGLELHPIVAGGAYYTVNNSGTIITCDNVSADPTPLCVEMGCAWNPAASPSCVCTPIDLTCPQQTFPTGINAQGQPICTPIGGVCGPGEYIKSISLTGVTCANLPAASSTTSSTCPSGTSATNTGGVSSTAGCFCPTGQTWSAGACTTATGSNQVCYISTTQACPTCYGPCTPAQAGSVMPGGGTCSCATCAAGTSVGGLGAISNIPQCNCNNAGETWNGSSCVASSCPTGTIYVASIGGCRPNPYQCEGGNPDPNYCSTVCGQSVAADNAAGMNCSYSCSLSSGYYYGYETCL